MNWFEYTCRRAHHTHIHTKCAYSIHTSYTTQWFFMVMIPFHIYTHKHTPMVVAENNQTVPYHRTEPLYNYFPGWFKQNAFIFGAWCRVKDNNKCVLPLFHYKTQFVVTVDWHIYIVHIIWSVLYVYVSHLYCRQRHTSTFRADYMVYNATHTFLGFCEWWIK